MHRNSGQRTDIGATREITTTKPKAKYFSGRLHNVKNWADKTAEKKKSATKLSVSMNAASLTGRL